MAPGNFSRRGFLAAAAGLALAPVAVLTARPVAPGPVSGFAVGLLEEFGESNPGKQIYGRLTISGAVIRASVNQRGAFAEAAAQEYRALAAAAQRQFEREMLG